MNMNLSDAIDLRLGLLGLPGVQAKASSEDSELIRPLLARQRELSRRLKDRHCATDARIQTFLDAYLRDEEASPSLPRKTFILDMPGLARALSLPCDGDELHSARIDSYRLSKGVLHNPVNDGCII